MEPSHENLRFYVYVETKRGQKPSDIIQQLASVFGDAAPSKTFVYQWSKEFRENLRLSCEDLPRIGRPVSTRTDSNISRVFDLVTEEPKSSTSNIASVLNLSPSTVKRILTHDLLFRKVCSVWIPHDLSEANKVQRITCAENLLNMFATHSVESLLRVFAVTDETWIPFKGCSNKVDNKTWIPPGQPRLRVTREQMTYRKTMLSIAFTGNGKVNMDTTERNETIDSERYVQFIKQTGDRWRTLHSDPTHLSDLIWMQDNARPHTAAATMEFLRRRNIQLMGQSPYSPDFNLCDRWLIKELKKSQKKVDFDCAAAVRECALIHFRSIPEDRFRHELLKLKDHCSRVVAAHGDYITH
jgi:transposase